MPDDYYVSQYSGEEIDDLLGKAGAGTVRYDAAQTLTDAQKAQARSNIGAAPSRFGLGENLTTGPLMQVLTEETLDTTYNNGWYFANGVNIAGFSQAIIRVDSSGRTIYQTAYVALKDGYVLRRCLVDTIGSPPYNSFGSWEWVNPPMQLGVEYRTTERYLGKPVYIRLEAITALPNNNTLTVSKVGVPSGGTLFVDNIVDYRAEFYSQPSVYSIPYNDVIDIPQCNGSRYGDGITYSVRTKLDYTNFAGRIWIKYTKQTD